MSPDAIAALVEAAKEGRLPEEPRNEPRRQRRMRTVDFTRPTKFTADQVRRIKRALETFCRTASGRLSAELRMPLELEVINVTQLTWSNAHAQVPSNSIIARWRSVNRSNHSRIRSSGIFMTLANMS